MRGFIYTLEAVISVLIIIAFLSVVITIQGKSLIGADLEEKAFTLLKGLDDQEILRNYTVLGDYDGLNNQINFFATNHSIQICDSASCSGPQPNASYVSVGTYVIAGNDSYAPYYVKLYLWS